jgi:predicted acetylornithine/succinylornithine family transaminase
VPETLATPAATPAAPPGFAAAEPGLFAPAYPLPRLELVSGRGAVVVDAAGREYLDFVSGIAVNALGHAAPVVARAVAKQVKTLVHHSNLFASRPGIELAQSLAAATGYDRVFFCNSGTEGIEAALKFARVRAAERGIAGRDVVAFRGGFHGRTAFALSATWHPPYREPFQPLMPGVRFADYNRPEALDEVLDSNVAAAIVEPVQGEAGAVPATREFLHALRARTQALGAALIFDEVQSGMGRCGRLLAQEHFGVRGDFTVLSKALGGGLPLGAVLMTADAAAGLAPGHHGCTFGGNPLAAAAGLAVLGRIHTTSLLARVRSRGYALARGLEALRAKHPAIRETRGLGLLQAIDLAPEAPFDPPALIAAARERGLLLVRGGERAVRLLPPLTVTPAEIAAALERLDAALASLVTPKEEPRS